jgi:protocatechuate 3,4-dioxygenase beta subunit
MTRSANCTSQLICMLVLCGFGTVAASGQASADNGRLEGRVLDQSGALLPGTEITITNLATGTSGTEHTDSKGHFEFLALAPGHYRVSFSE